jgi:hypothetical protein
MAFVSDGVRECVANILLSSLHENCYASPVTAKETESTVTFEKGTTE